MANAANDYGKPTMFQVKPDIHCNTDILIAKKLCCLATLQSQECQISQRLLKHVLFLLY